MKESSVYAASADDGTILIDNCDTDENAAGIKYADKSEYITGTGCLRSLVSINPKILIKKEIALGGAALDGMYLNFYFYVDTLSHAVQAGCYVKLYAERGYYLYPLKFTRSGWQSVSVKIRDMQKVAVGGANIIGAEFSWAVEHLTGSADARSGTFIRVDEITLAPNALRGEFAVRHNTDSFINRTSVAGLVSGRHNPLRSER